MTYARGLRHEMEACVLGGCKLPVESVSECFDNRPSLGPSSPERITYRLESPPISDTPLESEKILTSAASGTIGARGLLLPQRIPDKFRQGIHELVTRKSLSRLMPHQHGV